MEVIVILDDDDDDDEPEYRAVFRARHSDDEDDEETDDSSDWTDGSDSFGWLDSGYDTMSSEEEDEDNDDRVHNEEGDEEDDNIRPLHFEDLPRPESESWSCILEVDNSEETTPSSSGLNSSTKRSREDSDEEQHPDKRPKRSCEESFREEESPEEPTPSTSGLGSSTNRSWERFWGVVTRRPMLFDDSDSD